MQSGLSRQQSLEAGASVRAVEKDDRWFIFSLAAAATREDQLGAGSDGRFWGSTARLRQRWPLGHSVALTHTASLLWSFHDADDWRVNNVLSVNVVINRLLAMQLSHQLDYRKQPVTGKRPLDQTSLVSLVAAWPRSAKP